MLQPTKLATSARWLARQYSSPSRASQANVLLSQSSPTPGSAPPPPPTSSTSQLKPQPFIPKPRSRAWQISSLSSPTDSPGSTLITLQRGSETHQLQLPNLWLRDSSTHNQHRHPTSGQKLFRTSDLPRTSKVVGFGVHDVAGEEALVMEWSTPIKGLPTSNAKLTVLPIPSLTRWLDRSTWSGYQGGQLMPPPAVAWDQTAITYNLNKVDYAEYANSDSVLSNTLGDLLRDGLVMWKGVPTANKEGEVEPELRSLVERMASLRKSWYGALWDVKAVKNSTNIAYTDLPLDLHMDLTHFESPPRYQFLHCLSNKGVIGGKSTFVDSFKVAETLRHAEPSAFHTLCTELVAFSYTSPTHATGFSRPTIELVDPNNPQSSAIAAVNYSPPFQGPLPLARLAQAGGLTASHDEDRVEQLHDALRKWAALCEEPGNRWEVQLEEGDCVAFDNRRVLHAREGFTLGQGGQRWLKGAYCDGDEVRSQWRVLEKRKAAGEL